MPEIVYLLDRDRDATTFYADAAAHFATTGAEVVPTAAGAATTTLAAVLDDLRARATAGQLYDVVTLVCRGTDPSSLPVPVSEARRGDDGGRTTSSVLRAAHSSAGAHGYPAVLGPPAVTESTTVRLLGCAVGQDPAYLTLLGLLLGPALTVVAPLGAGSFRPSEAGPLRTTTIRAEQTPSTAPPVPDSPVTPLEDPVSELFGKYRAQVVDDQDPTTTGRLLVDVPAASLSSVWALACLPPVPVSLVQLPPAGAEVWVEFEGGDTARPIWTGALWHERTTASLALEVDGELTLTAGGDLTVQAGEDLAISAGRGARLAAATQLVIESNGGLELESAGQTLLTATHVSVNTPMAHVDGTVESEQLITTSVVSASYTPGVGNAW